MYIIGLDPDDRSTTPNFNLGQIGFNENGKGYLYVQADGAVTATYSVAVKEGYQASHLTTALGADAMPVGNATAAFANNEYGWVQVYGTGTVGVAGSYSDGNPPYTSGTAGRLDDSSSGQHRVYGVTVYDAPSGAGAADCMFHWPHT